MTTIESELTLRSGLKLKNRLMKSAMTENLSDEYNRATKELENLYGRWADDSGVGLLVTGNMQIDRRFMERARNVCIDLDYGEQSKDQKDRLKRMATAGKRNGTKILAQISHGGRYSTTEIAKKALSPSAISAPPMGPKTMPEAVEASTEDIDRIIEKFVYAAQVLEKAGFDGVELHGAFRYLLSTFFNPLTNTRTDEYGGSVEKRAALILKLVKSIREATKEGFTVAVKLNSTDFQDGGSTVEDAAQVAILLAEAKIDFLEITGGDYEDSYAQSGNAGTQKQESTKKREAFFNDFAAIISETLQQQEVNLPLAVNGGFRTKKIMNHAVSEGGVSLISIASPLCVDPGCTQQLLDGKIDVLPNPFKTWRLKGDNQDYFTTYFAAMQTLMQNMADIGAGTFEEVMSDEKYPDIMEVMIKRNDIEHKLAQGLKGYRKDETYLQDFLNTQEEATVPQSKKNKGCSLQ